MTLTATLPATGLLFLSGSVTPPAVARLIARGVQNSTWPEDALRDIDPRVRANMIDGLADRNTPLSKPMIALLRQASSDRQAR